MKILTAFLALLLIIVLLVIFNSTIQVFLLHKMYYLGSGMDDGATALFIQNKQRYKPVVLEMLNAENPNSYKAQASFLFGELLLDDPEVYEKIQHISQNHSNNQIRCFWFDVLDGRFESIRISGSKEDKFAAHVIKDKGSRCE